MDREKDTTMETVAKGRTIGAIRCLNCFERLSPPPGATAIKCPSCKFEWRIWWVNPKVPRIRGPVWDVDRKLAEDAVSKEEGRKK